MDPLVLRCKVALLGAPTVGKTALVQMFESNNTNFPKNYVMTMGLNFVMREMKVPDHSNSVVELYIHDIGGQSLSSGAAVGDPAAAPGAASTFLDNPSPSFLLLVYDHTPESWQWVEEWISTNHSNRTLMDKTLLVANKIDLTDRHLHAGRAVAERYQIPFFAVSASRASDIEAPFEHVVQAFYERYESYRAAP